MLISSSEFIPLPFCSVCESQCDGDQRPHKTTWRKKRHTHLRPFFGKQDLATALLQHIMAGYKGKIFREKKVSST